MKDQPASYLEKIIEKLKKMKSVKAAILFGSYARERHRKDSDIDICLITEGGDDEALELSSEKFNISSFHALSWVLQYQAFRDGKILFNRDEEFLKKTKLWTLKVYMDYRYRYDKLVANRFATRETVPQDLII